jgi:hypothetical protein
MRLEPIVRFFLRFLIILVQALLFNWAICLPIVWIVRDGLGPDSVDTGWVMGLLKTLTIWAVPALALAVPLYGLTRLEKWMAARIEQD